ncbi:MAG: DUF255 domain-containing protein [Crocinitomicaceae bacterium]
MKLILSLLLVITTCSSCFSQDKNQTKEINWISLETALKLNKTSKPKPIFIDVYTDWCGWCKKLDATTFKDSAVVDYMTKNYLCVKLNAEQKEDITFNDHIFHYVTQGNRGYNEIASVLLDGRLSYPSMVILSPKNERTNLIIGYNDAPSLLQRLMAK